MSHAATQFMWAYQPHFRLMAELDAKRVLELCDPTLEPAVFLVGVRADKGADQDRLRVEPGQNTLAHGKTLGPASFDGLDTLTESLVTSNPYRNVLYAHAVAEKKARDALRGRSLAEAVRRRLDEINQHADAVHFCATPVHVQGFDVVTVLRLKRGRFEEHAALRRSERNSLSVTTSLPHAAVKVLLEEFSGQLGRQEPGSRLGENRRPSEEFMRAAGRLLSMTAGYAGGSIDGMHGLFDLCNAVSEMSYERGESHGRLVICRRGHPEVDVEVEFKSPIPARERRTLRKLIEVTKGARRLITDGAMVYGVGTLRGRYDGAAEDLFEVQFVGHFRWELMHAGQVMMKVTAGLPELPRPSGVEPEFLDVFRRVFKNRTPEDASRIWTLVESAIALHRGCTLAIVDDAAAEAARLGGQAIAIEPVPMGVELLNVASAIDGAVLLDTTGRCHAMGVILDGQATATGDRSRGSRYNSAMRYQHSLQKACVIVVISEDGMIDVLPRLHPPISRNRVVAMILQLEHAAGASPPERVEYYSAMQWLKEHAFYLTELQCRQVNAAKDKFEQAAQDEGVVVSYEDLTPNPDLTDEYFFD